MAEGSSGLSGITRILIKVVITTIIVYLLHKFLEQFFDLQGGLFRYIIVGSIVTAMNVIVRPLLHVLLLPFKLFMGIIVIIVTNGAILWLTQKIVAGFPPDVVHLTIGGGWLGWLVVAIILGVANWMLKEVIK